MISHYAAAELDSRKTFGRLPLQPPSQTAVAGVEHGAALRWRRLELWKGQSARTGRMARPGVDVRALRRAPPGSSLVAGLRYGSRGLVQRPGVEVVGTCPALALGIQWEVPRHNKLQHQVHGLHAKPGVTRSSISPTSASRQRARAPSRSSQPQQVHRWSGPRQFEYSPYYVRGPSKPLDRLIELVVRILLFEPLPRNYGNK